MQKSELVDGLQEEYRKWQAFLNQIDPARMDQPGVAGHWSIKDIVAHLTGWRRRTVARLQAAQRNEPDSPPLWPADLKTDDEINAWIYETNHRRSVQQVLEESDQVFQQLLAAIEGLPEQILMDPVHHLPWLDGQPFAAGEFFVHFHQEHEPDIRAWLARVEKHIEATDTLTTLFSHNLWANLRLLERCAVLSRVQLDAAISGGYGSIHDTLQHIVTGEQLYYSLISTGQRYDRPEDATPMSIAEMTEAVRATGAGLIEWAPKVQTGDTANNDPDIVPKTIILTQAINHATEHRAQVMAILTQLGIEPPELDGWTYFDASSQSPTEPKIFQYIVDTFPGVETAENLGYKFFFYGADHMLPFATLATADNEGDRVSNLDRPGIFRLNIGVSKQTFQSLFGNDRVDVSRYDYTALDRIMPHPDYAPQNFICVLNPSQTTFEQVRKFLAEAYEIARVRNTKRTKTDSNHSKEST